MNGEFDLYADWYVWAKRNLSADARVCHAAAAAASAAQAEGRDRDAAIVAARQALASGGHLEVDSADIRRRTYAEWFDWARRELGGSRDQQAGAARAALTLLDGGQGANAAMAAARAIYGRVPVEPPPAAAGPPPPQAAPGGGPPYTIPPPPSFAGYAGFWRRLAAYALDYGLQFLATTLAAFVIGGAAGLTIAFSGSTVDPQSVANLLVIPLQVISLLMSWLYFTLCEASSWQATLGKRALRLRVTDVEGGRLSWARANGRYWSKLLSGLTLGIGFLMIAFTARKQGLHDMIAATLVVRRD